MDSAVEISGNYSKSWQSALRRNRPQVTSAFSSFPSQPGGSVSNAFISRALWSVNGNGYLRLLWYIDPTSRTAKVKRQKNFFVPGRGVRRFRADSIGTETAKKSG